MTATVKKNKRYNMVMPETLFAELERVARTHSVTVMDILRQYVKLGLLVDKVSESPDASLLIRDEHGERELVIIY